MLKWFKILKKGSIVFLMGVFYLLSYNIIVKADNISVSNWYSDEKRVGYWSESPKVSFSNLSGAINVSSYLDNAVKAWSNAGISSSITTTPANANIKLYGGTRAELIAMGFYYSTDIVGLTYFDSYSAAGTANSVYTINRFSKVSTSVCSEAGASYYTNVVMHEYGHALGWMGHASNAGDVMYYQATAGNISLTSHDKKQLLQIYSAMN